MPEIKRCYLDSKEVAFQKAHRLANYYHKTVYIYQAEDKFFTSFKNHATLKLESETFKFNDVGYINPSNINGGKLLIKVNNGR